MRRIWSVGSITWLSLVSVALLSLLVLGVLSQRSARAALETSLEAHVASQAGLVAAAVEDLPLETLALLGGSRTRATLDDRLERLAVAGNLHDIALCGPETVLGSGGSWLAGRAEADLITAARQGRPTTGALYRDVNGALFMTGYHLVPTHPGWVAAIEGSGQTLGALNGLVRSQLVVGMILLLMVGAGAAVLGTVITRPITRLDRELAAVEPGSSSEDITLEGPREIRRVAATVARLLEEIRQRDTTIARAHEARVEELTRVAAGIAHEIRNPLNAMSLTAQRLQRLTDGREAQAAKRLTDGVQQLEVIVRRLVDLTSPLDPHPTRVPLHNVLLWCTDDSSLDVVLPPAVDVYVDEGMLQQVLRNLILNAEQAGATTLTLETVFKAPHLDLYVIDNGPGVMSPESIFSWFHTSRASGSGLGLPHSRRLMHTMGGDLTLHTPLPATFHLRIPTA